MIRKAPLEAGPEAAPEPRLAPGSLAAQAAARVAARYAQAPSYSEMLANEARAAVLAAQAASRAAQQAHAAAQSILDSLEAASAAQVAAHPPASPWTANEGLEESEEEPRAMQLEVAPEPAGTRVELLAVSADRGFEVRWEPELPLRRPEPVVAREPRAPGLFDSARQDRRETEAEAEGREFEVVEPAQPIPANLIEFPRELVATRKVRPRLVEAPLAGAKTGAQLNIFEVDPGAISMEPEAPAAAGEAAPEWTRAEWSDIRLEPQPDEDPAPQERALEDVVPSVQAASAGRRLLAVVVDAALVTGAVVGAAFLAATRVAALPGGRTLEIGLGCALAMAGALYLALFLSLTRATPGMRYAQIALCTFAGEIPTRRQRRARLRAMLLSVLPVGLGLAWALFDEHHLTWHDRLSKTYLRRV